jgi:two-component system CheB/CheR fusion protein
MPMTDDTHFAALLDHLKRTRGFDFHAYKPGGLERRVQKRLQAVGIESYAEYIDYLEVHADEFRQLFNTILINVTGFFRDPPAWQYISEEVVPRILSRPRKDVVRVWSCGCASGEEAYTLAILFAEAVGRTEMRDRVKVYATDVDGEALDQARQATYTEAQIADVPKALVDKYFEQTPRGYVFDKELRRSVIFGRNDLIQDAPISRLDLLVCRNTLMYFNAEAQARILSRFHFALNDEGVLFLGKAELLLSHASLFTPLDMKGRIFSKVPGPERRDRGDLLGPGEEEGSAHQQVRKLREAAFDRSPVGEILLDAGGNLVTINDRARALLGAGGRDHARPTFVLDFLARAGGVRGLVDQVRTDMRPASLFGIEWALPGVDVIRLDVYALALADGGALAGVAVFVVDATRTKRLQDELVEARQELEAVSEELESTNEELETTNEELQSANEELQTTNEELQSTNEELETMNEELQSTNEELQAVNDEVRKRGDEVAHANLFLESILRSLRSAVVVVDPEMRVNVWSRKAEDLWGLRAEETLRKHMLTLDIGLPVEQLKAAMKACLNGETAAQELILAATNRRGKSIECEVIVTPLAARDATLHGVIFVMHER